MKTLKQWERSKGIDRKQFLNIGDEIDWFLYEQIVCGYVAPHYDDGFLAQEGEAEYERDGVYYYTTVKQVKKRTRTHYYYCGVLKDLNLTNNK